MSPTRTNPGRAIGFTMIEILVTLVILMIGLLGIAGLMAQGQRASFEAYQRQQALALANDMAERIKANRPGVDNTAVATTYTAAVPVGTPAGNGTRFTALTTGAIANCATGNCTTTDAVQYDAAVWDGLLSGGAAETDTATGTAIGPLLRPRGCIETLPGATACPACGGPPTSRQVSYRVSVAWQGNYSTAAPTASACGNGVYQPDDTFRRLVSVDVYTVIPCPC
ncbi:MAG: type IV pilus modification protein PilV [Burkholderiales bacterium]|nr:type IV pilus modification protein PilV [Burkholderiales bacterium]